MRRLLAALALLAGSVAGALLFRRRAQRRERVEVSFEDGSTISLTAGSPEASSVLPLARRILDATRADG